jgi:hypothetical protein
MSPELESAIVTTVQNIEPVIKEQVDINRDSPYQLAIKRFLNYQRWL